MTNQQEKFVKVPKGWFAELQRLASPEDIRKEPDILIGYIRSMALLLTYKIIEDEEN